MERMYIVTSRGRNREYATIVTVNGESDGDLYKRAQEKARQLSTDLASCGEDISAFQVSASKVETWLKLERSRLEAEESQDWDRLRDARKECNKFLNSL